MPPMVADGVRRLTCGASDGGRIRNERSRKTSRRGFEPPEARRQIDSEAGQGIKPAWWWILITMSGSFLLWYRHAASTRRGWLMHGAIAGLLCFATLGASRTPEWIGLFQLLSFLAVSVWMWTVFPANQREPAEASYTDFGHRVLTGI